MRNNKKEITKGCGKRIHGRDSQYGAYVEYSCGDSNHKALCNECLKLGNQEE